MQNTRRETQHAIPENETEQMDPGTRTESLHNQRADIRTISGGAHKICHHKDLQMEQVERKEGNWGNYTGAPHHMGT